MALPANAHKGRREATHPAVSDGIAHGHRLCKIESAWPVHRPDGGIALVDLIWVARRTRAVLRREGAVGTAKRLVKYLRIAVGLPNAETAEILRKREKEAQAFDADLGLDTGGTLPLYDLTIRSHNAALGGSYIATGQNQFRNAMAQLDIDCAGSTFVDLGSGKGRVLMMAADHPFAAIIGVEFAEELHDVCNRNLERFGDPRLSSHLGDAEQFAYPLTDLVVFMNNPFDPPLVDRIRAKLEDSARKKPRAIRVIYINAAAPELFANTPWRSVGSAPGVEVFALEPGGQ